MRVLQLTPTALGKRRGRTGVLCLLVAVLIAAGWVLARVANHGPVSPESTELAAETRCAPPSGPVLAGRSRNRLTTEEELLPRGTVLAGRLVDLHDDRPILGCEVALVSTKAISRWTWPPDRDQLFASIYASGTVLTDEQGSFEASVSENAQGHYLVVRGDAPREMMVMRWVSSRAGRIDLRVPTDGLGTVTVLEAGDVPLPGARVEAFPDGVEWPSTNWESFDEYNHDPHLHAPFFYSVAWTDSRGKAPILGPSGGSEFIVRITPPAGRLDLLSSRSRQTSAGGGRFVLKAAAPLAGTVIAQGVPLVEAAWWEGASPRFAATAVLGGRFQFDAVPEGLIWVRPRLHLDEKLPVFHGAEFQPPDPMSAVTGPWVGLRVPAGDVVVSGEPAADMLSFVLPRGVGWEGLTCVEVGSEERGVRLALIGNTVQPRWAAIGQPYVLRGLDGSDRYWILASEDGGRHSLARGLRVGEHRELVPTDGRRVEVAVRLPAGFTTVDYLVRAHAGFGGELLCEHFLTDACLGDACWSYGRMVESSAGPGGHFTFPLSVPRQVDVVVRVVARARDGRLATGSGRATGDDVVVTCSE